jgi:hypothetical protein
MYKELVANKICTKQQRCKITASTAIKRKNIELY